MLTIHKLEPWAMGWEDLVERRAADIRGLVVHRIEVSQEDLTYGDGPSEVVRFFREHPVGVTATGGAMPYPVLIEADGRVTQTLPLSRISPHAVAHNPTTVGVACIGDFRRISPQLEQRGALALVCAAVLDELDLGVDSLHGHDELAGGSRDPDKICPGEGISMDRLRADVAELMRQKISLPGLVW